MASSCFLCLAVIAAPPLSPPCTFFVPSLLQVVATSLLSSSFLPTFFFLSAFCLPTCFQFSSFAFALPQVVAASPTNSADEAALQATRDAEQARYEQLKAELQAWAAGLTAVCLVATFAFYGRDVAASYGVGALGGLVYLRLLNKTVDSFGAGAGGALGQPRLLIPVILALGYNRCGLRMAFTFLQLSPSS